MVSVIISLTNDHAITKLRYIQNLALKSRFSYILDETLLIVTADHSHSFVIYGKAVRGNDILGFQTRKFPDRKPGLTLAYANGPGGLRYENQGRANLTGVDYTADKFRQQALIYTSSESHAGEDVGKYKTN